LASRGITRLEALQVIGEVDALVLFAQTPTPTPDLYTQLLPYAGAETLYCLGGDIQYFFNIFGVETAFSSFYFDLVYLATGISPEVPSYPDQALLWERKLYHCHCLQDKAFPEDMS